MPTTRPSLTPATPRATGVATRATTAAFLALVLACESDSGTGIAAVSVDLRPDSADVVAGQEIQMKAEIVDLFGKPFEGLLPDWESADTSIATVDATGAVRGRAEGLVEIRASISGAEDVSRIRVLPHPRIVLSEPEIHWAVGAGGPAPPARTLSITNGGAGTLGTLELTLRHDPESPRWLAVDLAGPTEPTAIELSAETDGLEAGTYEATVVITSDSSGVDPVEVPARLTLTDFSLGETDDLTAVPEGSGTDTVLVVLDSPPTATVVLSVSLTGASATASPQRLDFTPDDWATPRVVTVSGVDDDAVDGDEMSELILAVDEAASDSAFHGIPAKRLQVITMDDDQAGFLVTESDEETRVSESGATDELAVVLAAQPLADVKLLVTSDSPTESTVTPAALVFTPGDWNSPQTVTVTGVDDLVVDGHRTSTVTIAIDAAASHDAFGGIAPYELAVITTDDDVPGIVVTESGGATIVREDGTQDDLTAVLAAQPLEDVVLTVSGNAPDEASASPTRLTFTPADWSTPQTITVRGADDPDIDGDQGSTVVIEVDAASSERAFHGLADTVTVVTEDDDTAGFVVQESSGGTAVDEGGVTDDLVVSLTARPQTDVVLQVAGDDPAEVAVTPAVLTFTHSDWQSRQVVTIQGVQDGITDGPQTSTVTLSIDRAASDDAFDAVPDITTRVTTLDVDTTGVSPGAPTGHPGVSSAQLVAAYNLTTLTSQGLLRDFAGGNLHGSISGTSVVPSPRGGARLFQVATDRIELPARSDFDLDGPLTVVARFRLDVPNRHQHVLACDDKFGLAVREADQVRFSNTRGDFAETLQPLSTGAWHTVIGVFRGTVGDALDDANVEIWIDGARAPIQFRSGTGAVPPVWRDGVLHPTDACYIGYESHQGDPTHQNLAFHGAVDEILVFGRALTTAEVQSLSATP